MLSCIFTTAIFAPARQRWDCLLGVHFWNGAASLSVNAMEFRAWLSKKECRTYRLPTKLEWEYACRGNDGIVQQRRNVANGLFAAVSFDEGKTCRVRKLVTPGGYLTVSQTRDGRIQLLSSRNHYAFNLTWIKQHPPAP